MMCRAFQGTLHLFKTFQHFCWQQLEASSHLKGATLYELEVKFGEKDSVLIRS